jgi:hypothetical protein
MSRAKSPIDKMIDDAPAALDEISSMPLNSLEDYIAYNKAAAKANKKYKICRYPIKPCPIELHPKEKVIFSRNDQPRNPLAVYKSDDMIDFKMELIPGKTYELPRYIIEYLAQKGTAVWTPVKNNDGTVDTKKTGMTPRFSVRTVYEG